MCLHGNDRGARLRNVKMATRRSNQKESGKSTFQWSDDEVELLLNVTYEYKVYHTGECTDWEKVPTKYADILKHFHEQLPSNKDEPAQYGKDFPHKPEEISLKTLTSELKAIRLKYRQAADSGKKSGHGRVIMCYFELCQKVWGGSPATVQISSGLDSNEINFDGSPEQEEAESTGLTVEGGDEPNSAIDESQSSGITVSEELQSAEGVDIIAQRRALLSGQLHSYRHQKLKRKLPADMQLLECAQQDLAVKRSLVFQMNEMVKMFMANMTQMSANMDKLTSTISDGFALLRGLLLPQHTQPMYGTLPYHTHPHTPVPHHPPPYAQPHTPISQHPTTHTQPWANTEYEEFDSGEEPRNN